MGNPVVGIDYKANLADLRAQLAKLPEIGGDAAKAMVSKLSAEIRKAEAAAKAAGKSAEKGGEGFKAMGAALKSVGLGSVVERMTAASTAAEEMGVSLAVAGAAGAALAVVGGIMALAYKGWNAQAEHAAAIQKVWADGMKGTTAELRKMERALLDAQLTAAGVSDGQRALALSLVDADAGYRKATEAAREHMRVESDLARGIGWTKDFSGFLSEAGRGLADLTDKALKFVESFGAMGKVYAAISGLKGFAMVVDGVTTSTKQHADAAWSDKGAIIQQQAAYLLAAAATEKARIAQEKKTAAERAATKAVADHTRELADERAAEEKAAQAYGGALDAFDATIQAGRKAMATTEERAAAEHAATQQMLRDQAALAEASGQTDDDRTIAHAAFLEAMQMEDARYFDATAKMAADAAAKVADEEQRQAEQSAAALQAAGTEALQSVHTLGAAIVSGHTDTIARLSEAEADARSRGDQKRVQSLRKAMSAEKEAARSAFLANQQVSAGEAVVKGILAVSNALATVPYPAAPIVAGLAAATTAANVVAIESEKPPFHAGGGPGLMRDERYRVLGTEREVTALGQRSLPPSMIDAANRGQPIATSPIVQAQVQFSHRHFDKFARANVQRRGSMLGGLRNSGTVGR